MLVLCSYGFAQEETDSMSTEAVENPVSTESSLSAKKIDVSGYGAIEAGQIHAGRYAYEKSAPEIQHVWIGHVFAGFSLAGRLNKNFSLLVSLESRVWYNTSPMYLIPDNSSFGAPMQNFDITIPNAEGILTFGEPEKSFLRIDMGRFEYKYNPQAQDLGEYLFRTGCYPAYIKTTFDLPLARINGIDLSYKLLNFFKQDLLLTTMSEVRPFLDFNLTYIADASIGNVLDVGAGVQFEHLFPVDGNETINSYTSNGYIKSPSYVRSPGDTVPADTAFYKFAGTKLMLRFMFNPIKLFDVSFFGEKDCQIYAEAAVLGLESYPKSNAIDTSNIFSNRYGYDNILQKIPVTFGFNVPTFKLLDVLSLEGEWFGSRYKNSYEPNYGRKPAPALPQDFETEFDYAHDDWKWAVYAKKTIFGGLSFVGLIGRDHLRTDTYIGQYKDYETTLVKNNQWYWMFKIKYAI
jgi:hypothetical protein